jgi:hypothetical protein
MYSTHYVCISIDEFYELLQTPEEAAKTTHDCLHEGIVILLQLVIYIFQYDSNYATYGKNKRTKCYGTQMVTATKLCLLLYTHNKITPYICN